MTPRPVSITIFGILNIGFAIFGFGSLILSKIIMALVKLPGNNAMTALMKNPAYVAWLRAATILGLFSYTVLLAAGIGLLLLKSWGRITSIAYAVYAIIWALVNFYAAAAIVGPAMEQSMDRLGSIGAIAGTIGAVMGLVFSLAYPILLLIFMTRPNVIAAFQTTRANVPQPSGIPPAVG